MGSYLSVIFIAACLIYFCTVNCVQIKECLKLSLQCTRCDSVLNASIYPYVSIHKGKGTKKIPEGPDRITIDRKHITWHMKGWRYVHYFLLKISYTSIPRPKQVAINTEYALIKITNVSISDPGDVEFTCLNVKKSVAKIETELWTLGNDIDFENRVLSAGINKYNHASSYVKIDEISRLQEEEMEEANICICFTEFKVKWRRNIESKYLRAEITRSVKDDYRNVEITSTKLKVDVSLNYLSEDAWKPLNTTKITFELGKTTVDIVYGMDNLPYDMKNLTVNKLQIQGIPNCHLTTGRSAICGLEEPVEWYCDVPPPSFVIWSSKDTSNFSNEVPSSPTKKSTFVRVEQSETLNWIYVAILTILTFLLGVFLLTFLYLLGLRIRNSGICGMDKTENDVAIVCCPESLEQKKHIELLERRLKGIGCVVKTFGMQWDPSEHPNWVDLGEQIVKTHSTIIFVISTMLIEVCRRNKSMENQQQLENELNHLTGDLEEMSTLIETEIDPLSYPHRLPAVVLDSLRNTNARGRQMRNVLQVIFVKRGEKNVNISQLEEDNLSVFRKRPIKLVVVHNGIQNFKNIQRKMFKNDLSCV